MTQNTKVTEEEQNLMEKYGITHEQKSMYFYQGYKYERLSDTIKYARNNLASESAASATSSD